MNRRRNLILIGVIYGLALVGLLAAIAAVAGLLPLRPTPASTESELAMNPATVVARAVPTLRPIWPAEGSTSPVRRGTRTPVPVRRSPVTAGPVPGAPAAALSATPFSEAPEAPTQLPPGPTQLPGGPGATAPTAVEPPATPAGAVEQPGQVAATVTTESATATPTAGQSEAGQPGQISGRVLINNAPPASPLALTLENKSYQAIARATTGDGGSYAFPNVPASAEGYNVVFSQDLNPNSQIDRVATWAWLGPVPVRGGQTVDLPALDIALMGLQPSAPAHEGVVPGGQPVNFSWTPYPQATGYWLDLSRGDDQQNAWQSPLQPGTSATWDGTVAGQRAPGTYWWGVGARKPVSQYMLVLYSYLIKFTVQP